MENIVLAIIQQSDKVLLGRERGKTHFKLPGGHVDGNETDYIALVRELGEELDVKVERVSYSGKTVNSDNRQIRYYFVQIGGVPKPQGEIDELLWVEQKFAEKNDYFLTDEILSKEKHATSR